MNYANRVLLQGYLELERVEEMPLLAGGVSAMMPVLYGWLWTDAEGRSRHRVMLTDKVALGLLGVLRRFRPQGGSALVRLSGTTLEVAQLDGKPFVAVEGRLVEGGVVDVKHISVLSTPEAALLRLLEDHRLREIAYAWSALQEADRALMYRLAREARQPLSLTALGHGSPDGAGGGLSSTPPTDGRMSATSSGGGTGGPPSSLRRVPVAVSETWRCDGE